MGTSCPWRAKKVGRFLHDFAVLEREINERIAAQRQRGRRCSKQLTKEGKVTVQDPLWSKKTFEEASAQVRNTCDRLAQLRSTLTYKVVDGNPELVSH